MSLRLSSDGNESSILLTSKKKLRLSVTVRAMDSFHGKRVSDLLFDLFKENGFEEAVMFLADRGYNRRGFATSTVLGLSWKLPVIIRNNRREGEGYASAARIKEIVGSNGWITLQEIEVL